MAAKTERFGTGKDAATTLGVEKRSRVEKTRNEEKKIEQEKRNHRELFTWITVLCVLLLVSLAPLLSLLEGSRNSSAVKSRFCNDSCMVEYVESIPTGMTFRGGPVNRRTHEAWLQMLKNANRSIHIAALYWNLNSSWYSTAIFGRQVFSALVDAGQRGVQVQIAQDGGASLSDNNDSKWLADQGLAEVRSVDFAKFFGAGVLHTKFIIADYTNAYIGSANMDWKSLAEVKELGLYIRDCPCLAVDLHKIFAVYWHLGQKGARIPKKWPTILETLFNKTSPMHLTWNDFETHVFISSSPAQLNPAGREQDLVTIISLISSARHFVHVAVMDLLPQTLYMGEKNSYWPYIDDAFRIAAFRGVSVRLLVSHWDHSPPAELAFLRSLIAINEGLPKGDHGGGSILVVCSLATHSSFDYIEASLALFSKLFTVPSSEIQKKIPFARVNHNKYMVTDCAAYVGTSNWAGDYFINTAGVGLVMAVDGERGVVQQLQDIFIRDWDSPYAYDLLGV